MKLRYQIILCLLALPINILILNIVWNWIIPSITRWSEINYLQACGLFVLYWSMHGMVRFTINTRHSMRKNSNK